MSPRTLKILAIGYAVKTLLVGLAWLMVPDLPTRAANLIEQWGAASRPPDPPRAPAK